MLKPIKWSTKAGSFKTKRTCDIESKLPAFHEHRKTSCTTYVDESQSCNDGMIIGQDIMHSLGINQLLDMVEISWDNTKLHMQPPEVLQGDWIETFEQELLFGHDPDTMDAERIQGIIESKSLPSRSQLNC